MDAQVVIKSDEILNSAITRDDETQQTDELEFDDQNGNYDLTLSKE